MRRISFSHYAIAFLFIGDIFVILAHIYLRGWLGFFDLDKEGSLKALFSGFQLLASGMGAGCIAYLALRLRASRFVVSLWAVCSALFGYLALDDMMMIHERVGFVLNNLTRLHGTYESFNWLLYFSPFIVLGAIAFVLVVRSLSGISVRAHILAWIGLAGFVVTLLTEAGGKMLLSAGLISIYHQSIILEEASLLFGETFFLIALAVGASELFKKAFMLRDNVAWNDAVFDE
ncbi:MAG: hypothetical protein AAB400_01795 [Patescibacteria group bacterium]